MQLPSEEVLLSNPVHGLRSSVERKGTVLHIVSSEWHLAEDKEDFFPETYDLQDLGIGVLAIRSIAVKCSTNPEILNLE